MRSCLHLWRIISIAEFSETEAAHAFERVNSSHEWQVALSVQCHEGATEEVVLDCELGDEGGIGQTKHLVGSEKVLGIIIEIED